MTIEGSPLGQDILDLAKDELEKSNRKYAKFAASLKRGHKSRKVKYSWPFKEVSHPFLAGDMQLLYMHGFK